MEKLKFIGLIVVVIAIIVIVLALIVYAGTEIQKDITKRDWFGLVIDSAWMVMLVGLVVKAAWLWYIK